MYDILIQNASVADGTGAPVYQADVAVKDGRIVLQPDASLGAAQIMDAAGLTLCPGFIDSHSHADERFGLDISNLAIVSQGITTSATGQCGETMYPISTDARFAALQADELGSGFYRAKGSFFDNTSLPALLHNLEGVPIAFNYTMLTGHTTLRMAVMGVESRKPTAQEMEKMKVLLRDAMEHGSMGLSSGLIYAPGAYADAEELTELCKVVAEYDGFYATHMRNEASGSLESLREAIAIAEASGCRLNLSHHKICGKANWGLSAKTVKLLHEAAARGVRLHADAYPYTASMSYLDVCMPGYYFERTPDERIRMLRDSAERVRLEADIKAMDGRYNHCGGFENIYLTVAPNTPECIGKSVAAFAKERGVSDFDAFFDLLIENGHQTSAIYFSMCEEDLQRIVCDENICIGTDGILKDEVTPTHPRTFGAFPKAIRYFVREKKLLTLEQMIHKITQFPAERLGLANKGAVLDGYDADLVLFDANTISDRSTYTDSLVCSAGISRVLVNGQIVYEDGKLTGIYPGRFLPRNTR